MPLRKEKKEWRSEEEKERRRANYEVENEKNAYNSALKRCQEMVEVKLEKERKNYPKPNELSEEVTNCALVKAIDDGKLNFLKGFRMKDKASFVPLFFSSVNPHVLGIRLGLQRYGEELNDVDEDYHNDKMELIEATNNFNSKFISSIQCQVRRLGGGVYVVQASWSTEDHGSVRRVSLGGR
jgi:hypothetical protein